MYSACGLAYIDVVETERLLNTLSSKHWSWTFQTGETLPSTLIALLERELPHITAPVWTKRLESGGAFINGKAALENVALCAPCRVEYYETKYPIESALEYFPKFNEQQIVYRDQHLALAVKPPGLPCFEAREQRLCNFRLQLENYFGHAVHMPSRLDTSVSGLVLISLSELCHDKLQKLFERREIEKMYILQSAGDVDWSEKLFEAAIDRDKRHAILRQVVQSGGKSAITKFVKIKTAFQSENSINSFRAFPHTGRTHQIRVHAAHLGLPIVGDNFYGGIEDSELHLASFALKLNHPITNEPLQFSLPSSFQPSWLKQINA